MKSVVHIVNERASDRYWIPNPDPSAQCMFDVIWFLIIILRVMCG